MQCSQTDNLELPSSCISGSVELVGGVTSSQIKWDKVFESDTFQIPNECESSEPAVWTRGLQCHARCWEYTALTSQRTLSSCDDAYLGDVWMFPDAQLWFMCTVEREKHVITFPCLRQTLQILNVFLVYHWEESISISMV